MRILKILLILLVPALGIVSCTKSDIKPECSHAKSVESGSNDTNSESTPASREEFSVRQDGPSTVVGSGDDDRDGGDKKQKKSAGK